MSNNQVLRGWEERVVLADKGSRIVHYILRDTTGSSILAVMGTERSLRHMAYSVSVDYLLAFGSTSLVNGGTRWQSRKEVVEWLRSIVSSNGPLFADPSQRIVSRPPTVEKLVSLMARFSNRNSSVAGMENSDISWSGDAWECSKQLKHFPAFCRTEIIIAVHSFVFVMGEEKDYLAHVEDLFEDEHGKKMSRVRWFKLRDEIKNFLSDIETHPNEAFITPIEQEISVESIDGLAVVLTPKHFEKCLKILPRVLSSAIFICHREFRNKQINPFCFTQLRGYSTQPIISSLISQTRNSNDEEDGSAPRESAMEILKKIRIKLSNKGLVIHKFVLPEPRPRLIFKANENIEVLSQDSGMRGCWFRCKILHSAQKHLKVQYYDILNVDGPDKLEECIPSSKVAVPDKLGMRCAGRLTVRPWPSKDNLSNSTFEVGTAVDAWWADGWWEGVIIGRHTSQENSLQVYLPGEHRFSTIKMKNVRISKDWIDGKWMNINPKPDILSFFTTFFNPMPKLPQLPVLAVTNNASALANGKVGISPRLEGSENCERKLPCESKAIDLNFKKRLIIRDHEDVAAQRNSIEH